MITQLEFFVRGCDGIPYKISVQKLQPQHRTYITIKAELDVDEHFNHIGPEEYIILEGHMKSKIEDWRLENEEYKKIESGDTFIVEPWLTPPPKKSDIPKGFSLYDNIK